MKPPMAKNKDLRNYSIIPIEAVRDHRLHGTAAFSVLALLCTYTDQLGVTWVSQGRIAQELGVSRPAVARQIKKLKEYGYITDQVKRLTKNQPTKSIKVIFKNAPTDLDEARSNLSPAEQINLDEYHRKEAQRIEHQMKHKNKPVDNSVDNPDNSDNQAYNGVTSEVTSPVTPLGYTNVPLTYSDKSINSDLARQFCVLFLRSAESFGTPRQINDRDVETMDRWIREGLERDQWCKILDDHWQYCRKNLRDYARGIGYFQMPVSKVLGKSNNYKVNDVLKAAVRSTRT